MKFSAFLLLPPMASAKLGAPQTTTTDGRELNHIPSIRIVSNPAKLPRCGGDCDHDGDCSDDLVCFERDEYDAVPGCSGGLVDASSTDYCIRKTDDISNQEDPNDPPVKFISNPPKLGLCDGDCDADEDCGGELVCFQRDANEEVPGCSGGASDGSRTDFCVEPSHLWWDQMSSNSLEDCGQQGQCAECAACSTNDDCIGEMVCFQTTGSFPIPGCSGWEYRDSTFSGGTCVHPKYNLKIEKNPLVPLNECTGDCDADDDCFGDLICFHREKDEKAPVPGCVGGEVDGTKTDYCVFSDKVDDYIGRYESYGGMDLGISTLFPLTGCKGDCDSDSDCRAGLVCFQRDPYEAVPGCDGGEQDGSRTDYCVDASDAESFDSNQPSSCVAEAVNCGLNPGSWEDYDELDCDSCCYGYHYFLRMSDRENKAYCKEAPNVRDWPNSNVPKDTSECTFRSEHCGLNPGSWEDYEELDCANCCYGYHSYLDEFNENKAYCMQDATVS